MQDPIQGQATPEPASLSGQPATPPADESLKQFLASPETPAPKEGEPQVEDPAKELLRLANQRQAEIYRLQAELQATQQQRAVPPPVDSEKNPFDPNQNWVGWMEWNNRKMEERIAQKTQQVTEGMLQNLFSQAQEATWAQSHPGVDVNAVKNFARVRGISNLDDAYKVLTFDERVAAAGVTAAQTAINSFRQPQNAAQPMRGTQGSPPQTGYSFEKLLNAYNANPDVYNGWPEGLQKAFDEELIRRDQAG